MSQCQAYTAIELQKLRGRAYDGASLLFGYVALDDLKMKVRLVGDLASYDQVLKWNSFQLIVSEPALDQPQLFVGYLAFLIRTQRIVSPGHKLV